MSNPKSLKPFVKGDPRINRKGRPRSFDMWRALTIDILREPAKDKEGNPLILDKGTETEHIATNAEMIARSWLKDPKRQSTLIEAAFGKVPDKLDVTSGGEPMNIRVTYDDKPVS